MVMDRENGIGVDEERVYKFGVKQIITIIITHNMGNIGNICNIVIIGVSFTFCISVSVIFSFGVTFFLLLIQENQLEM